MHLLALLDQPDDGGTLMVGNTNADELSGAAAEPVTQPGLRVRVPTVLPHPQRHRARQCVLEQLEMADKAKNKAVTLSGGQNNESSSPAPW
jgi:putative ABC transport system ATP-binding protein